MDIDFDLINNALETAARGTKAADGAIGLVKRVKELFGSAKSSGNSELESLVVELMGQITDTKLTNVELKEQLIALRESIIEAQAKQIELDRYELWEAPAGSVIYRLKKSAEQKEPDHYLCPHCMEDGVKSILQGHSTFRRCPRCDTGFPIRRDETPTIARSSSNWDGF